MVFGRKAEVPYEKYEFSLRNDVSPIVRKHVLREFHKSAIPLIITNSLEPICSSQESTAISETSSSVDPASYVKAYQAWTWTWYIAKR